MNLDKASWYIKAKFNSVWKSWGKVPSKHTTHGSLFVIVYAILEWQQVTKIHQKGRKETTVEGHRPSADGALISENSWPNV